MSKKTRKSRRDDEGTGGETLPDGWDQFTSPDGHLYYYNADTKESRWELPAKEKKEVLVRSKSSRRNYRDDIGKVLDQNEPLIRSIKVKKEKIKEKKKTMEEQETVATAINPSNVMFRKLQASLGGKLEAIYTGPPPMMNIRREGFLSEYTGGTIGQEATMPLTSVEEEYETETAGMSAAERLRFLRKKRQENMMLKRENSMEDDFMAEVAKNMKKKGVVVLRKEEREGNEKMVRWEEQEKEEEERKRRQMQGEMEMKKERNEQITKEREERQEQERVKQLELEQREQEQQEEKRKKQDKKEKKKKEKKEEQINERNVGLVSVCHETSDTGQHVHNQLSVVENVVEQDDDDLDVSSPERVKHRKHNRSQGSKHGISVDRQAMKHMENVEDDHPPADDRVSPRFEVKTDAVQDDKQRMREERRARKQREKEMLVASKLTSELPRPKPTPTFDEIYEESQTQPTSSIEVGETTKARTKHLRRERRQMAKMEAALAAQNLDGTSGHENAQPVTPTESHTNSSNGPTIGLANAGGYPMSGQPLLGQPPFSGGMCPSYPYIMMPPPPSPYGYYYSYMQPYSLPIPMYPSAVVPPGYQLMPTPPHSANGMAVPSALIPYGTDTTLANAYGYDMHFGGTSGPEVSRCDCCKGIGVGLVEKNGVCAHCNRLRLAFILDSAQMRLRCSVCGGWGFQLLQANGMCEHCTRSAQKSQWGLLAAAAARRPSSVATATTAVQPRQTSAKTKPEKDEFDDIDWDQSSLDDSDWDD
ncbi:unnamed protein product [Peronospora farinosa]|uniref:WW domain-containing protein n=1 Tax=Peronospora farinosa TaxID=134698 RepID=A0ABN8BWN8_9STRA|nr:unnamed protein product [Peronospora farinosa]